MSPPALVFRTRHASNLDHRSGLSCRQLWRAFKPNSSSTAVVKFRTIQSKKSGLGFPKPDPIRRAVYIRPAAIKILYRHCDRCCQTQARRKPTRVRLRALVAVSRGWAPEKLERVTGPRLQSSPVIWRSFECAPVAPLGAVKVLGDKRTARIGRLMLKMGGLVIFANLTCPDPATAFRAPIVYVTAEA
jgi:hypothetical protein